MNIIYQMQFEFKLFYAKNMNNSVKPSKTFIEFSIITEYIFVLMV